MKRRGFLFGAIAAPTIIAIDGRMKFFMPPRQALVATMSKLIVPLGLEQQASGIIRSSGLEVGQKVMINGRAMVITSVYPAPGLSMADAARWGPVS